MTNLQQRQNEATSALAPERWLVLGPTIAGGVLALGAALGLGWPIWQEVQKEQAQVESLRELEQQLPLLRRQLAVERERSEKAALQQQTLQQLIAGSGTLATFMAQVDRLASAAGVRLDLYEPQAPALPPAAAAEGQARREGQEAPPPPADPLLAEGLEKRSLLLRASGKFPQLLSFLRQLETLSVLVSQSDLNLTLEEVKGSEPAAAPAPASQPASSNPAPPAAAAASKAPRSQVVLRMGVSLYENAPKQAASPAPQPAGAQR